MDLLQQHWNIPVRFAQKCFIYSSFVFLLACASVKPDQPVEIKQATVVVTEEVEEQQAVKVESLPLSSELVYFILMAEIAGQRGEIGVAVELYHKAAGLVESPAVAGRSAQIATFTRDQQRMSRALKRWAEVDPTEPDAYILQVPLLLMQKNYDEAIKMVDRAVALSPDNIKRYLARLSDSLDKYVAPEKALDMLQQLQAFQSGAPEALLAYARLATFYKHYNEALPLVDEALKQQPKNENALILKAEILQRQGHGDRALSVLSKAVKNKDVSSDMQFAYAKLLGENNKIKQAQVLFEQLHHNNPENDEILFALGLIALENKDGEEAKHYFSQLIKQGDQGKQATYFMGLAEELNGDIDAALVWFASVSADSHRFQSAQTQYINLLAERGDIDKARLHLKLLRKEFPDRAVQYFLFEASFLREQGLNQAAFDLYSEALKIYPEQRDLLYSRAMVAEPLNRLSILEDDLKAILTKNPNNAQALNALGYTLADRTNRYQEALALIQKAVSLKPNDPFYLDSLGWVYYRLGNLVEAQRYLEKSVAIQADVEFLAHLGEVLWQQGKRADAKRVWQQGLDNDPENKLLKETIRRLDR